ncbi:MAG: phosphoribosylformylglycinamidine synthase subunit PurL [Thermoanaerobaculia bacterium]|nr:phosphoribosylformylglycinamidine synthase subunit PurL [Thermoanaerobaculia bacterium]
MTKVDVPITPALLREHKITPEEFERIKSVLGREPNLVELGIFSALWSEHCSYKSSRVYLKEFPTKGPRVLQGPGENAGAVDIGDGWAVVFKMESHNHPSFIEPYQGAATGVGGILRDVFTMGARPVALLDPLFFGDPDAPRMHSLIDGVVRGVGGYGNCVGIPTVGGMTLFHPAYNKNILVNVMAVGLVRHDRIFRAKASGVGNPVLYAGSKTGRDGIHGASMASDVFDDEKSKRRPTVQVGDPFAEKLLLEAVLEVLEGDAVVAIQDMGAAGLTSSTFEMCSRGGVGMKLDLTKVPAREEGMTPYEFMLSESQERMVLVVHKGREAEVIAVFEKWGVDVATIGEVIGEPRMELHFHGETVANLPIAPLVEDAPVYRRPVVFPEPQETPVVLVPSVSVDEALRTLLQSPNLCGKRWIFRQYDWSVQTNTVLGPGHDAAVIRVKGTNRGLAMTADVNPRFVAAHPERGAALAVAEAALNIACTGARPLAITDCLNFGNPERPEIMGQFAAAIAGISRACRALETPVISGNVSLYNETDGRSILPTPTIGMVGLLEDVTKALPSTFQHAGDEIAVLGETADELGASEYLATVAGVEAGPCPRLDLERIRNVVDLLVELADKSLLSSAHDAAEGGLAIALSECGFGPARLGADLEISTALSPTSFLFSESSGRVVISYPGSNRDAIQAAASRHAVPLEVAGKTVPGRLRVAIRGAVVLEMDVKEAYGMEEARFPRLMEVTR